MTTYDLRTQDVSIDELFHRAADEFEREVALLSQSDSFMAFLAERSRQKEGSISLEELEREIEAELAREQAEANDQKDKE